MVANKGEGFHTVGWRFAADKVFNRDALYAWLNGLQVERVKAVALTEQGAFSYNCTDDALLEMPLESAIESRLEIIASNIDDNWQAQLLACI